MVNDWIKYIENQILMYFLFIILEELLNESNALGSSLFKNSYIEEVGVLSKTEYPKYVTGYLKNLILQLMNQQLKNC